MDILHEKIMLGEQAQKTTQHLTTLLICGRKKFSQIIFRYEELFRST